MNIKPIFFIIILGYIYIYIKYWKNKDQCLPLLWGWLIFSYLFCDLGYFLEIGSNELKYYFIGYPFIIFYSFFPKHNSSSKKGFVILSFFALQAILLLGIAIRVCSQETIYGINHDIIADSLWNGVGLQEITISQYSIIVYLEMLIFTFSLVMTVMTVDKPTFKKTLKLLTIGSSIFLLLSYFEFVCNNVINPTLFRDITKFLFGMNKTAIYSPYYRVGLYSILVTCQEPSYVAKTLFFCNLIFIVNYVYTKKSKYLLYVFLSTIISILGLTLSSIVFAVLTILIFVYLYWRKIYPWIVIGTPLWILLLIIFMNSTFTNYFMERGTSSSGMISMFFASDGYQRIIQSYGGSTAFRELGMLLGLQSFFSHFFLGVGIGTITSTSGLISILSNIGIIGFISLVIFWKKIFVSLFDKRLSNIAIFIGLLSQLVLGGIADYSFSPLLILLIYLLQISKYQSKKKINRKPLNSYIVQQGCELCKN